MDGEILLKLLSLGDESIHKTHKNFSRFDQSELIDLSFESASIQTIYRILVKFLCEKYSSQEEYCALIGIPSNKRLELREEQNREIDFLDNNYFVYHTKLKDYPDMSYAKLRKFNGQIFQTDLVRNRHAIFIYAIENLLNAYNIKYLLYNLHEPIVEKINTTSNYYYPYDLEKVRDTVFFNGPEDVLYAEQLREYYNDNYR